MLLSTEDAKDFFRLHASLIRFVQVQAHRSEKRKGKPKALAKLSPDERFELHRRFAEDPEGYVAAYLEGNPDRLPAAELAEVAAWKRAVAGKLLFLRQLKKHFIVVEAGEDARVFGVWGLVEPIEDMLSQRLPVLGEGTLLPFRGKIVCDGLISAYRMLLGPGMRKNFEDLYRAAKRDGLVLTTFDAPPPAPVKRKATKRATASSGKKTKADALRRLVASLRKRLGEFRKERAQLCRFEDETLPAFQAWLDQRFGKEREEVFRLREEIDDLQEALDRLDFGPRPRCPAGADVVEAVLAEVRAQSGHGADDEEEDLLDEPPVELMEALFETYMEGARGVDLLSLDEKEVERAFEEFRETFRHAAEGNQAAFERSLLGIGADRSPGHVKAVNAAYRRVAKRLHPDKHADHDEETTELWETLRQAKAALDLAAIERVETEWRLLRGEAFVEGDEAGLKTLQGQLRLDFAELKALRRELETHPMWGRKEEKPPKDLERSIRSEILEELRDLRDWKQILELRLEGFRRRSARRPARKSAARKGKKPKAAPKDAPVRDEAGPDQMEFGF